jgi:hypothetical protein
MKTPCEVDRLIEQLGNHAAGAHPDLVATIDAMVIVLGARLSVAEIESRWRDRDAIKRKCLVASQWLAGQGSDRELLSLAGLELSGGGGR